jgi:hypothetical protein
MLLLVICWAFPAPLSAESYDRSTLLESARWSDLILYGRWVNPRKDTLFLEITSVLKDNPLRAGKKKLQLPFHPSLVNTRNPPHLLVFADKYKGEIDVFRTCLATETTLRYVKGLLALDAANRSEVLRHCFDYLESKDKTAANDAHSEFRIRSTDRELAAVAKKLSPEPLRRWLTDPSTFVDRGRANLYGFLLGGCGQKEDVKLLESLIRDFEESGRRVPSGLLAGRTLLRPPESWSGEERGILAVKMLGGIVERDSTVPQRPVVAVLLGLSKTKMTDADLVQLKGLSKLRELWLGNTQVTGEGLRHLQALKHLEHLELFQTPVNDQGLAQIGKLVGLRRLSLADTNITDQGMPSLQALTRLEQLSLTETRVTNVGIVHLKTLTKLRKLTVSGTSVTSAGIRALRETLPKLETY